jgi:uncharacterized repeat protein (TIGR04076 family)
MTVKELRFQEGSAVTIELVEAKDASLCRFGYKVGDSWEVNIWENAGLCGLAYYNFFPFISMLQTGGEAVWKTSERDMLLRTCPDLRPGFVFRIKRKE